MSFWRWASIPTPMNCSRGIFGSSGLMAPERWMPGVLLRGRIELFEWAQDNPGACVFIGSVKTIRTKGGFSYADNEHAAAFLTFLKEAICPFVTVVLLAHDGTKAHRAGGAAA